jgi:hypothetical protein
MPTGFTTFLRFRFLTGFNLDLPHELKRGAITGNALDVPLYLLSDLFAGGPWFRLLLLQFITKPEVFHSKPMEFIDIRFGFRIISTLIIYGIQQTPNSNCCPGATILIVCLCL